jgi:hypothetical protein
LTQNAREVRLRKPPADATSLVAFARKPKHFPS